MSDVTYVVLAYYWRGEQRGNLWTPVLNWSEPFLLDVNNCIGDEVGHAKDLKVELSQKSSVRLFHI